MKKTLSYVWPLTKRIRSEYSGILEITWLNGKKLLDSPNANYSYGALQRVLDHGLAKVQADRAAPVLVLGLGGGGVLELLRKKYKYYGEIKAVELDPAIIEIAEKEFKVSQYRPLEIVAQDALQFVSESSDEFGLIIVDIFLDLRVPEEFFSMRFWDHLVRLLKEDGKIIFNAGIHQAHEAQIEHLSRKLGHKISFQKIDHICGSNTLLFGSLSE